MAWATTLLRGIEVILVPIPERDFIQWAVENWPQQAEDCPKPGDEGDIPAQDPASSVVRDAIRGAICRFCPPLARIIRSHLVGTEGRPGKQWGGFEIAHRHAADHEARVTRRKKCEWPDYMEPGEMYFRPLGGTRPEEQRLADEFYGRFGQG